MREAACIAKAEKCKDLANEIVAFNEEQRDWNLLIAKLSLEQFDSIPARLEPLLEDEDYFAAADLLRANAKTSRQIDGVLDVPVPKLYAMLDADNPDVPAVRKLLEETRLKLNREYLAAKITKEDPSGSDVKTIDQGMKLVKQGIIDA